MFQPSGMMGKSAQSSTPKVDDGLPSSMWFWEGGWFLKIIHFVTTKPVYNITPWQFKNLLKWGLTKARGQAWVPSPWSEAILIHYPVPWQCKTCLKKLRNTTKNRCFFMNLHQTSCHPGIMPIICSSFGSIIHVILGGWMIFENQPLHQDEACINWLQ